MNTQIRPAGAPVKRPVNAPMNAANAIPSADEDCVAPKPRILVVEDEPATALDVKRLLEKLGYEPLGPAANGLTALDLARTEKPDMALVDIDLGPGMDGIELARILKSSFEAPSAFLTANDSRDMRGRAASALPFAYLLKPVEPRCLQCAVEAALCKGRVERKYKRTEKKLQMLFEGIFNAYALFELIPAEAGRSNAFRFIEVNSAFEQVTGLPREDVEKRLLSEVLPGIEPYWTEMLTESAVKRISNRIETYLGDLNQYFHVHVFSPAPGQAAMVLEDITDKKRGEQRLWRRTFLDPLTALPNRALCLDRISRAIERSRRRQNYLYAVAFLDLDRFKLVNDSLGHPAGDKLLSMVSERLSRGVRRLDTVARVGGDEFVVVLEEIASQADALAVARKLRASFEAPFEVQGRRVHVSASMGVVLGPAEYDQPEELLQNAAIAMNSARKAGRGRIKVFNWSMRERAERFMDTETSMRDALENNEFFLQYQPILNLSQDALAGFEALARWRMPDGRIVPPGEFIPVAEETGLINPIGRFVMREASRTMREWTRGIGAETQAFMSVNLSARQFSQPDLVKQLVGVLRESDLPANRLKLEITESVVMDNPESAMTKLRGLRDLGAGIAIDDFGTGYSSLSYLQSFPVDTLKVDRSFVGGMQCAGNRIIVKTVINLGHGLGFDVVGEGVETPEHHGALRELGCDLGQGFYYARPMDESQARELLRRSRLLTSGARRRDPGA